MSGNRSLQSPQGKAILVVGTLTGGVLGYYFGYDSKPQTQTPTFQAMLQSVQLWKGIERELRERYIELRASESSPLLALAHHDHPEVVEQATRDKRLHPFDDKTIFDKKDSTTPAGK